MTTTDPHVRAVCQWCQATSAAGSTSCPTCGAPLDGAPPQTVSGWRASPKIKDHTAIRFGTGSGLAVEGEQAGHVRDRLGLSAPSAVRGP